MVTGLLYSAHLLVMGLKQPVCCCDDGDDDDDDDDDDNSVL